MEWSEVYTRTQKERLIASAVLALRDLIVAAKNYDVKDEIEITSPMRSDVLIVKDGQLMERCFWVSTGMQTYAVVHDGSYGAVVEKYKVTPELAASARELIDSKFKEKTVNAKEESATIEELEKLDRSEKVWELLGPIKIAGSDRGDKLMIDAKSGIYEKCSDGAVLTLTAICRTHVRLGEGSTTALKVLIKKYNLTARQLADWREKIEK